MHLVRKSLSRSMYCASYSVHSTDGTLLIPFTPTTFVYRDYMAKYTYHHHHPVLALKEDLQSGGRQAYRNRTLLAKLCSTFFLFFKK